jgi:hypothetical protein
MIKLTSLLENVYAEPTNSKFTSIISEVTKSVKWLFNRGSFKGTIIDYGCGKIARNTIFLREQGLKVYSYDKFWGKSGVNGWSDISSDLPNEQFYVGFTSFVLNVVNINEEDEILQWMQSHTKKDYHITRNQDITKMIKQGLERGDKIITDFFTKVFKGDINKPLTDQDIQDFAFFGTKTPRGFQRIPELQSKGYKLIKIEPQVKIYERE